MRWFYLTLAILLAATAVIFMVQNVSSVTISFLTFSVRAPVAVLIAVSYVLGAVSGGSLFALVRRSYEGSQPTPRVHAVRS